jgi:NAD+ synthase (glutamine-hydrolysing)
LPNDEPVPTARERYCEDLLDALALGIGDYFEKTKSFERIGIALSGGRDSLLTLLIAHRYATRAKVPIETFFMPTRYSSGHPRRGGLVAKELGVGFSSSIDGVRAGDRRHEGMLGERAITHHAAKHPARLRAQRMWNWANSSGGLFLQTGNMSEKAVGYTTIGGDLMGALAVIANVPKTVVMVLLDHLLAKHGYEGIKVTAGRRAGASGGRDELCRSRSSTLASICSRARSWARPTWCSR